MRIDLSRPLPGLLMALPLIAILLSVSRVPIGATQSLSRAREAAIETTGTAAVLCAPDIGGQSARAIAARLGDHGNDRWNSLALVGEQGGGVGAHRDGFGGAAVEGVGGEAGSLILIAGGEPAAGVGQQFRLQR